MRVAVFSESSADEAALRILTEAVCGSELKFTASPRLKSRGWPSVLTLLPGVIRHAYYQEGATAVIVAADSNNSPVHSPEHGDEQTALGRRGCRYCLLRREADAVLATLSLVEGRGPFRVAIGVPVPAIEAWYGVDLDAQLSEAAWVARGGSGSAPYRNQLKRLVYGTDRPNEALAVQKATEHAQRIANDLELLETMFPSGFGLLASDIRAWR